MFLLRAAFWLTIVLLLLPAPETGEPAPRVGIFEAFGAAQSAVRDISSICERQQEACETGGNALQVLSQKLRYGSELIYQYFQTPDESDIKPAVSEGGLRPDEMQIPWKNPADDKSV